MPLPQFLLQKNISLNLFFNNRVNSSFSNALEHSSSVVIAVYNWPVEIECSVYNFPVQYEHPAPVQTTEVLIYSDLKAQLRSHNLDCKTPPITLGAAKHWPSKASFGSNIKKAQIRSQIIWGPAEPN